MLIQGNYTNKIISVKVLTDCINRSKLKTSTNNPFSPLSVRRSIMQLMNVEQVNEILKKYIGGQMEIQNIKAAKFLRGEIRSITIEQGKLLVEFSWLAELSSGNRWIKYQNLKYETNFQSGCVKNVGPSPKHIGGDDRLLLSPLGDEDEIATLFPVNGSKLDPTRVEGLQPTN